MNDEVNLYRYFGVINKRKGLIITILLATVLVTLLVNLVMPKIYRGEYMVYMATYSYYDALERINSNDKNRLKEILPGSYEDIEHIDLKPLPDSVIYKLFITIEAKDTAKIQVIKNELFAYLVNFPEYKKSVEQKGERLEKEFKELKSAIAYPEEILKTYNQLLKSDKLVPIVFNPVDLYTGMSELVKRKSFLEQQLKNLNEMQVITEELYTNPVKPKLKRNVMLAVLIGLLAGFFFAFVAEFAEKVTKPENE